MTQDPFWQLGLPLNVLQWWPQFPQLFGSQFVSVSHPFQGLPSQSLNDEMHEAIEQLPFEHLGTAWFVLHCLPQEPQLPVSLVRFVHPVLPPLPQRSGWSPGQLWKQAGGLPLHDAPPPLGAEHTAQLVPHELVDVELSGTHVPP